jgi:hypothetical protein
MKFLITAIASLCLGQIANSQVTEKGLSLLFSHELMGGYAAIRIPIYEWRYSMDRRWIAAYEFGVKKRYYLKLRYLSYPADLLKGRSFWYYNANGNEGLRLIKQTQEGVVILRNYQMIDAITSFKMPFQLEKFRAGVGIGYAYRKAIEGISHTSNDVINLVERKDQGVAAELTLDFLFLKHVVTGAEIGYRNYDHGDPMIIGNVKLGILLRH